MIKTEDAELIKFFDWVRWHENKYPAFGLIFHPENERKSSQAQGSIRKRKGVRKGMPDIIVPIPLLIGDMIISPGLVIELKTDKGKLSADQAKMLELFVDLKWRARVARSADDAIEILGRYMQGTL